MVVSYMDHDVVDKKTGDGRSLMDQVLYTSSYPQSFHQWGTVTSWIFNFSRKGPPVTLLAISSNVLLEQRRL